MSATSRKAYLVITCTFLLGLFIGLIISPLVWRQSPAAPPNLSGMVDELSVELSLTPDQRQQVEKILVDTRQQFQDLRKQYHPQMMQIRDSSHEKISSLLTPEQKVRFDEWKQRQDAKRDRRRNEESPKERR